MSNYYLKAKELAYQLGYTQFTKLQDIAFSNKEILSNISSWIFVIGNTSSGKTLIPLMRYFLQYLEGRHLHMLFAVPYRALAAQKYREILSIAEKLGLNIKIVVSTGELRSEDADIRAGNVDIAVIIYEKIFMFSSMDVNFFHNYQLLVMDEIGLAQDITRGMKADFIMARAKSYSNLSVMALGTPYYDWCLYLSKFQFICIREDVRPIKLKTFPIYVDGKHQKRINHVETECSAVTCGMLLSYKNRKDDPNPRQWWDEIIEDICTYHLKLGHKILIFINNREEVHKLSKRLYSTLVSRGCLERWIEEDEVTKYIFNKMNLDEEDAEGDLYGVFDKEDYIAFTYGVSYHNASIPNSLRNLVEEEVLESAGHLRIVCCTETLAYGINSNVDVVIIPDMIKQRSGEIPPSSFLSANEYMNYAGRAGRLYPKSTEGRIGYVYPIIRAEYKKWGKTEDISDQQVAWEQLCKEIENPNSVFSRYYDAENEEKPFYLLSLFPNTKGKKEKILLTQIVQMVKNIPASMENVFDQQRDVLLPLNYLLKNRLICKVDDYDDYDDEEEDEYYLTDIGAQLTGFIIRQDDFENLLSAIERGVDATNIWVADLFYAILSGKEIWHEISSLVGNLYKMSQGRREEIMKNTARRLWVERETVSMQMKAQIQQIMDFDLMRDEFNLIEFRSGRIDGRCNRLRIMAALLFWISPYCTVKKLYNHFGIGYPQMQRVAEKVSYHLDIAKFSIPLIRTENDQTLLKSLGRGRIQEIQDQIEDLSRAVYFQISSKLCKDLEFEVTDPVSALKMRQLTRIYTELRKLEKRVRNGKSLTKKEKKYVSRCKKRISSELSGDKNMLFENFWEVL